METANGQEMTGGRERKTLEIKNKKGKKKALDQGRSRRNPQGGRAGEKPSGPQPTLPPSRRLLYHLGPAGLQKESLPTKPRRALRLGFQ